jgi:AcrR family transcriptional regulator
MQLMNQMRCRTEDHMRTTPANDLRVTKTLEAIDTSFRSLMLEAGYERITVKALCDRARINKKTFYRYYETLDDLLAEVMATYAAAWRRRTAHLHMPDDLAEVTRELFFFGAEQDALYDAITCDPVFERMQAALQALNGAVMNCILDVYNMLEKYLTGLLNIGLGFDWDSLEAFLNACPCICRFLAFVTCCDTNSDGNNISNEPDKVLAFLRGERLFVFNFNPTQSFEGYGVTVPPASSWRHLLDTDEPRFGGQGRIRSRAIYVPAMVRAGDEIVQQIRLYLPARTALVLERMGGRAL